MNESKWQDLGQPPTTWGVNPLHSLRTKLQDLATGQVEFPDPASGQREQYAYDMCKGLATMKGIPGSSCLVGIKSEFPLDFDD